MGALLKDPHQRQQLEDNGSGGTGFVPVGLGIGVTLGPPCRDWASSRVDGWPWGTMVTPEAERKR